MQDRKVQVVAGGVAVLGVLMLLYTSREPTVAEFIKYPSLQQKWSLKCQSVASLAADRASKGCEHFRAWQAAVARSAQDTVMNRYLGK